MKKKKVRRIVLGVGVPKMEYSNSPYAYCQLWLPDSKITNQKLDKYVGKRIRLIAEVLE